MINFSAHHDLHLIIVYSILLILLLIDIVIGWFLWRIYKEVRCLIIPGDEFFNINAALREMMEYHSDFYDIHEKLDDKMNLVIKRQGKLGLILKAIVEANRRHDRKVAFILSRLGETVPEEYEQLK
jgi:hypothetical protein